MIQRIKRTGPLVARTPLTSDTDERLNTGSNFSESDVEQSIAARFEQQVAKYPERIALKTDRQVFTYRALNKVANRVAQTILSQRGEGEEPIALLVEQGITAVVMLLGVLKAGKSYVPLNPSHPRARLVDVVRDVEPALILSSSLHFSLARDIAEDKCHVVNHGSLDASRSELDPKLEIRPDALGYLFYTSGSTGRPKGVPQSQRNILHQIMTYSNGLHISPDDHITMLHSHAFSASRLDIFGALLNGATVFPFSVAEAGIMSLIKLLKDEKITISHWIPTLFRHVVNALGENEQFPRMRLVVLGSEPVLPRDIALYKSHFAKDCILVNRFGTTETGNICWNFFNHQSELSSDVVSAGYQVPGVDVFLIDEHGNKLQTGEVGEICVQSRYLSQGYWKRAELTQSVFLPDPSGGDRRIYLTGDLGRMHADGCLDHLGRKDFQIKIRGFRIEKIEIEALLSNHPSIQEAVVELEKDRSDDGRLVGYIVLNKGRVLSVGELRSYLAAKLPHYMVPSVIVFLKTLPRTPNGKIDRQALSATKQTVTVCADELYTPEDYEDYTERKLLDLWEDILGIKPIGINDNFFDLGGQSLLAIQLADKIGKVLNKHISPAILYQATTIKKLAKLLNLETVNESLPSLLPIQPQGSKTPFFWIHGDSSNAFLPDYLGPDQPLYGLEHQSEDGKAARFIRVETIAEHYLRQIRKVQAHGPYLVGGYSFGGTIAFEIAQQLKTQGQTVSLLVMLDSLFPGVSSSSPRIRGEPSESSITPSQYSRYAFLHHLHVLAPLRFRGKIDYILVRFRNGIENTASEFGNRFGKIYKQPLCRVCLAFGCILPASVRSFYILEIYKHALQNYSPVFFPGRAVYFKTASRSSYHQQSWKSLMKDGLEVYEVPGDHMEIIKKENAEVWAKRLKSCISAAQTKN